ASWDTAEGTKHSQGDRVSLPKMFGHRDVNYTECPGDGIYSRFGSLRNEAQAFNDGGWKEHLWAFQGAGGASALGSVIRSAHRTGRFTATQLTKGLVLQESGDAYGYATPCGPNWSAGWGRPTGGAVTRFGQTVQTFDECAAVRMDGRTVFHDSRFIDVPPDLMFRKEIEQLASRGITTGWPDGSYRPL